MGKAISVNNNESKSGKFKTLFPYFLLAVAIICAYKIIIEIKFFETIGAQVWSVAAPFLYGFVLAYIINIPSSAIQRLLGKAKLRFFREKRKGFAILFAYLIFALIVFLIITLLIPVLAGSISLFVSNFPKYYDRLLDFIDYINGLGWFSTEISIEGIGASLQKMINDLLQSFEPKDILSTISALLGVSSVIFNGFLTFISSIYILAEKDRVKEYLCRLLRVFFSSRVYNATVTYAAKLNANFKRYLYTQTIDGLIIGTLATIELSIIKSPYALNLGIFLGIVNYIPYFGSIIGSVIAIVVVAFSQGLPMAGIAAAMLIVTQQVDGNIIQPRLMGHSFSISPLLLLFCIVLGGTVGGVIGMIAAIPIVAVLKDLIEQLTAHFERKKEARLGDAREP
jgi:predicted PurR-regulated permease PerM